MVLWFVLQGSALLGSYRIGLNEGNREERCLQSDRACSGTMLLLYRSGCYLGLGRMRLGEGSLWKTPQFHQFLESTQRETLLEGDVNPSNSVTQTTAICP